MESRSRAIRFAALFLFGAISLPAVAQRFSPEDVERMRSLWTDRYNVDVPRAWMKNGLWQVRLTVAGSQWLWNYNKVRGLGKVNPSLPAPPPQNADQAAWEKWIEAKVAMDRWEARQTADELNKSVLPQWVKSNLAKPAIPGSAPLGLIALAGNPPSFAEVRVPLEHTMRFEDDVEIRYEDNVAMRPRYAYYRFETGVMSGGKRVRELPERDLKTLFEKAELDESIRKVMGAVSLLEGGFDSVNTYDTGFVSVGFIQFASLKDGAGSLGRLLRRYKSASPDAFETMFRKYGIDVTDDSKLVALDLDTGAELVGADANKRIIEDKRLIAVFQHAGLKCEEFRVAQIRSAHQDYYPGEDEIALQIGLNAIRFKIKDVIRSEAGMATLMDRKVNTGTLDPLTFVANLIATENGLSKAEELQKFERDIIVAMKFRKDYLADPSLSQPPKAMKPERNFRYASRKGKRFGRRN